MKKFMYLIILIYLLMDGSVLPSEFKAGKAPTTKPKTSSTIGTRKAPEDDGSSAPKKIVIQLKDTKDVQQPTAGDLNAFKLKAPPSAGRERKQAAGLDPSLFKQSEVQAKFAEATKRKATDVAKQEGSIGERAEEVAATARGQDVTPKAKQAPAQKQTPAQPAPKDPLDDPFFKTGFETDPFKDAGAFDFGPPKAEPQVKRKRQKQQAEVEEVKHEKTKKEVVKGGQDTTATQVVDVMKIEDPTQREKQVAKLLADASENPARKKELVIAIAKQIPDMPEDEQGAFAKFLRKEAGPELEGKVNDSITSVGLARLEQSIIDEPDPSKNKVLMEKVQKAFGLDKAGEQPADRMALFKQVMDTAESVPNAVRVLNGVIGKGEDVQDAQKDMLRAASEASKKIEDKKTRKSAQQEIMQHAQELDQNFGKEIEEQLDKKTSRKSQRLSEKTLAATQDVANALPATKSKTGMSKKKKRILGGLMIAGGLGLAAGIGLLVWQSMESSERNETEQNMDQIKLDNDYTLESKGYQDMLRDDIKRLEEDGYTVEVSYADGDMIGSYVATKDDAPTITFTDVEYIEQLVESEMAKMADTEVGQEPLSKEAEEKKEIVESDILEGFE
ncbi:MAG: hypothetical protein H6679_04145 [Epsilonproteobacteria bacterium]|nr:hypothetical protein [Campylobacterota bacterium]